MIQNAYHPSSTLPYFDGKARRRDKTRYSGANKWMAIFLFFSLRYFTPNIPVLTES